MEKHIDFFFFHLFHHIHIFIVSQSMRMIYRISLCILLDSHMKLSVLHGGVCGSNSHAKTYTYII